LNHFPPPEVPNAQLSPLSGLLPNADPAHLVDYHDLLDIDSINFYSVLSPLSGNVYLTAPSQKDEAFDQQIQTKDPNLLVYDSKYRFIHLRSLEIDASTNFISLLHLDLSAIITYIRNCQIFLTM
jgi:hypothetical protein